MKIDKELVKTAIPYLIGGVFLLIILKSLKNSASKTIDEMISGDILKSSAEKQTDKAINKKIETQAKNWFQKELQLPVNQRTTIKRSTALNIANNLHNELRNTIQTMTGANQIYLLLSKIGTLGSLYYLFGEFGVRDGMDLQSYLYKKVGFNNAFSKDLDEINALFRQRKINYQF